MTDLWDLDRDGFIEATAKLGHHVRPFQASNAMGKDGELQSSCRGCGLIVRSFAGRPLAIEKGFEYPCTNAMHGGKPPPDHPVRDREGDVSREVTSAIASAERTANSRRHILSEWVANMETGAFSATCQRCSRTIGVRPGGKVDSRLGLDRCIGPNTRVQGTLMEDE